MYSILILAHLELWVTFTMWLRGATNGNIVPVFWSPGLKRSSDFQKWGRVEVCDPEVSGILQFHFSGVRLYM